LADRPDSVRPNITQGAFTFIRRNRPGRGGLYRSNWRGFFMSGCSSNDKDQGSQKKPDDGWREPPGYLGEAVRRAKLIPSRRDKAAGAGTKS